MLIKKTESELLEEQKLQKENLMKNKIRNLVLVFMSSFFAMFIIVSINAFSGGSARHLVYKNPLTFTQYQDSLSQIVLHSLYFASISIVVAMIFYKNFFGKRKSTTYLCDRCKRKKTILNKKRNCDCGGTFHSLDEYKWQHKN